LTDAAAAFAAGTNALEHENASDAIGAFESLADEGVIDANASFDRGLAYAQRVRLGGEVPGDLGRAIHGFEEAHDLARDSDTKNAADRALSIVRAEIARRRVQAGEPATVEQSPPPHVAFARALGEDTWAMLAIFASCVFVVALVVRSRAHARRLRVGATVAVALAALTLVVSMSATAKRKNERLTLEEAIVVSSSARPLEARGIAKEGAPPLPEGARVQVLEISGGLAHFRWGDTNAWLPTSSLRTLARAP